MNYHKSVSTGTSHISYPLKKIVSSKYNLCVKVILYRCLAEKDQVGLKLNNLQNTATLAVL